MTALDALMPSVTHDGRDVEGAPLPPAISVTDPTHLSRVASSPTPPPARAVPVPNNAARVEEYGALNGPLAFLAESLNDIEHLRIAAENRLRQMETGALIGLSAKDLTTAQSIVDELAKVEHQVTLQLQGAMRRHPLGAYVKGAAGVGEKQGARLLAATGNPYWNARDDRPRRGPAELWAYCGFHVLPAGHGPVDHQMTHAGGHSPAGTDHGLDDAHAVNVGAGQPLHPSDQGCRDALTGTVAGVAPRRRQGQLANWNSQARTRAWLVAKSCEQQPAGTHYRDIYLAYRAAHDDDVHQVMCEQCSLCLNCDKPLTKTKRDHLAEHGCPDRRPAYAQPGSPLKKGHQQARALRVVAKAVLKDIFVEAKAWHERD